MILIHWLVKHLATRRVFARWCVWRGERLAHTYATVTSTGEGMLIEQLASLHDCRPPHSDWRSGDDWFIRSEARLVAGDRWRCRCGSEWVIGYTGMRWERVKS